MRTFTNTKTGETITEAEYKKRYGAPDFSTAKQVSSEGQDYLSRVGSTIKTNLGEAMQSATSGNGNLANDFSAGANIAKNLTGAVLSPIAEAPGFKQIGEGFNKVGQAIVESPIGNKLTDKLSEKFSPQTLGTTSDLVETALNVVGIKGTLSGIKGGFNKTKSAVNSTVDATKQTFNKMTQKSATKSPLETAIKDATPDYESLSSTKKGQYLDRVQEGGTLEGRSIKPNKLEIEAGAELSKVPGYNPEGTKLSKYQATKAEITKQGQAFKESLKGEKQIVPKKETAKVAIDAINQVPNKSLLLQSSDPVIKNYIRVLKTALIKEPGNLSGVQRLIEVLDDAYENARGKQAFGSDKISALDDVHTAARNALTDYLIKKAKSTNVKAAKRSLWNLYRALDALRVAAEKESGSTVGRFMQSNPMTTKVIKGAANATGIGGAVNLMTGN